MPFAASVIKSKYKNYFGKNLIVNNYNYMTNCTNTLSKSSHLLSASIHPYDKTCRPQIISKNQNTNYEDLISKFGKITGIYALLNTSFNLHGYPIVNSIEDAIDILIKSNLDGLITEKIFNNKKMKNIKINKNKIGNKYPTYFIADIGANHDGSLNRAKKLIKLCAKAGANAAKFQHFKAETIVSDYGFKKSKNKNTSIKMEKRCF